ncbi:MAG: copper resistance protein NlpE N-terminal domain-containing protein [Symbiopectobacterium sp.]
MALGLLLVFVAAGLMGCHTPKPVREEALQPMAQSYRGISPCANCVGIDTSLFLAENGTFIMQHYYQLSNQSPWQSRVCHLWQMGAHGG